jgi:primosomal protein N'
MRADVLVLRQGRMPTATSHLYSYAVPERLAAGLEPGQLVSVPLSERVAAGIVWALDASDDAARPDGEEGAPEGDGLRELRDVLLAEPLVLEPQRALAEWIAD